MELAGQRPDPRAERRLQVHVDVLEGRVPGQRARLHLDPERVEPLDQPGDLRVVEQAGAPQAPDVGDRAGEIVERERAIDLDGAREVGGPRVRLAGESPAPEPHAVLPYPSVGAANGSDAAGSSSRMRDASACGKTTSARTAAATARAAAPPKSAADPRPA